MRKKFTDEETGISYTLVGNYYVPNLVLKQEEKVILNKYGRLRLNYLKKHKKAEYTILFMEGQLNKHLNLIKQQTEEIVLNELIYT